MGSFVVQKLRARGCREVFVPRSRDYDLVDLQAVRRLLHDSRPDLIIHLAARVGGILQNQRNPGLFFHDEYDETAEARSVVTGY